MMAISVLFFSGSLLLIKLIHDSYGTSFWVITLPRFALGLIIVRFLFSDQESVVWKSLVTDRWMLLRGLIGGLGVPLYNLCIIELGAGRASILTSTYPIFAALIAPLFLPEPLKWRILALSAVAITGTALMSGLDSLGADSNPYDLLALAVAIMSGLVIVAIRKLHSTHNTATIFAAQCAFGLVICIPGAIRDFTPLPLTAVTLILLSALMVAVGQLAMTHAFKHLSAARGSSIQLLGPPLIATASFFMFDERLSMVELAGAGLILFSCYRIAKAK